MAAKKTTKRKKASAGVEITDALVKKIFKARKDGVKWDEISDQFGVTSQQHGVIRARMKDLDPDSVQKSGPSGGTSKKTAAKKIKKSGARRRPGKKTARKRGGSPRVDEA